MNISVVELFVEWVETKTIPWSANAAAGNKLMAGLIVNIRWYDFLSSHFFVQRKNWMNLIKSTIHNKSKKGV